MGGLLILLSLVVSVLLWADLDEPRLWIVLGLTLGYGVLGFVDDYQKVRYRNHKGVSARTKLFWQMALAFGVAALDLHRPELRRRARRSRSSRTSRRTSAGSTCRSPPSSSWR